MQQMVLTALENQKGVSAIMKGENQKGDDTDALLLLCFQYLAQGLSIVMVHSSPVKDMSAIDVEKQ